MPAGALKTSKGISWIVGGPLPERTGKDELEDKDPAHRDDSAGDGGREAIDAGKTCWKKGTNRGITGAGKEERDARRGEGSMEGRKQDRHNGRTD